MLRRDSSDVARQNYDVVVTMGELHDRFGYRLAGMTMLTTAIVEELSFLTGCPKTFLNLIC